MFKVRKNNLQPARKYRGFAKCILITVVAAVLLLTACTQKEPPVLHSVVSMEAGGELPAVGVFLAEESDHVLTYDCSQVNTAVPGEYPVTIVCDEISYPVKILVQDTIAPEGTVQELTADYRELPQPEAFVTETRDATKVTVAYGVAPDAEKGGAQEITILLTDEGGNVTMLTTTLTVIRDTQAPEIAGVADITLYQGGTVAYRSGVTVTDDQDPNPVLTIDSSAVDLSAPGVYQVIYTAKDASGNRVQAVATITVLEKKEDYAEMETIYEMGQQILADIIEEDMTDREKVTAIYRYVRRNHGYGDGSQKEDWLQGAYTMMKTHGGDCFNYFALCKLLLELEGIPNIDVVKVQRFPGDSRHYWSLVSVDGGETYYHVDTTPRYNDPIEFLLVTDAYMDAYSKKHHDCFNRDLSLYPATPEE